MTSQGKGGLNQPVAFQEKAGDEINGIRLGREVKVELSKLQYFVSK